MLACSPNLGSVESAHWVYTALSIKGIRFAQKLKVLVIGLVSWARGEGVVRVSYGVISYVVRLE
jgi:hypothetical protein